MGKRGSEQKKADFVKCKLNMGSAVRYAFWGSGCISSSSASSLSGRPDAPCTLGWKDEAEFRMGGVLQDPGWLGVSLCVRPVHRVEISGNGSWVRRGSPGIAGLAGQVLTGDKWKFVGWTKTTQPFPGRGCRESGFLRQAQRRRSPTGKVIPSLCAKLRGAVHSR